MGLFSFKSRPVLGTPLRLRNTMTRSVEDFTPLKKSEVTLYTCGPTVYDVATIGNFRSYVFADILKRTLIARGYKVNHTVNLTDFGHLTSDADEGEDKMVVALKREGKPQTLEAMLEVARRYSDAFKKDSLALGILAPTRYTPASDYIKEEIALVKMLFEKGYTYEIQDGLYFDVSRFPAYGKLGNIDLSALKDGARIEVNPEKKHPADFCVWKKGQLGWDSPWGPGFPGWHIECTAMVFATLGRQIDIHTGGIDHISTHHNGEIAQAEAATGKSPYVRYWMHNAFITIDGKRIGKSVGNALHLRQLTDLGYSPYAYRYWLLTGHYSSPMNFTFDALDGARQAHFKLRRFIYEDLAAVRPSTINTAYQKLLLEALSNDLDTPKAIATIWELVKDKSISKEEKRATLAYYDETLGLGLFLEKGQEMKSLEVITVASLSEELQNLLHKREEARNAKDWERADALRAEINLKGYLVEDGPDGMKITKSV